MAQQDTGKVTCKFCGAAFNSIDERTRHNEQQYPEEMARMRQEQSGW